jgi:hypothetical protein
MGTETEYAIHSSPGAPLSVSEIARTILRKEFFPQSIKSCPPWTRDQIFFLSNGAKYHVDIGDHPEYSTPEAFGAIGTTVCEFAGVEFMRQIGQTHANRNIHRGHKKPFLFLRSSANDDEGWGYHINMLAPRSLELKKQTLSPLLLQMIGTSALFGGGYVSESGFRISQKLPYTVELIGSATTRERPLINTRDEAHADELKHRRLHIIGNDVLHSPFATWLRLGLFDLGLALAEARPDIANELVGYLPIDPKTTFKALASDREGTQLMVTQEKGNVTIDNTQEIMLETITDAVAEGDIESGSSYQERDLVLNEWEEVIDTYRTSDEYLPLLDWRLRHYLYTQKKDKGVTPDELAYHDMNYNDITAEDKYRKPFAGFLAKKSWKRLDRVFSLSPGTLEQQVAVRLTEPPRGRAYARAGCGANFVRSDSSEIVRVGWEGWQKGERKVRALDPLKEDMRALQW